MPNVFRRFSRIENPKKKRLLRFGFAMLALGWATLMLSMFLSEGSLRWICTGVAAVSMVLALVNIVRASSETDSL